MSAATASQAGGPAVVAEARTEALFLDFDGTLVEIAETPDGTAVPATLVALLGRLQVAFDGAVAIVTGRTVADIDGFLAPLKMVVAGVHGGALRLGADDAVTRLAEPIADNVFERVTRVVRAVPGVLVEHKGTSIAVHWRAVPTASAYLEAELRHALAEVQAEADLILTRGRRVFEIVPRRVSKGAAIAAIAELPAFHGRRPIMIGDDVSDESAFEAAEHLGGIALRVAGEHFTDEIADFRGPAQVRAWLAALVERTTP
ncbi:trehalose-phosphatase [Siculibacillus lacustris]|uniref:Trehalose 6-phosphate phosphatase n=1 Tax=Siculibacillus lacustris TaxID=1549641 RepID=A0A4Q9VYS1_9HYPH|nr:trehalose-phosphatase [Siculibacillus lacustris]TBW40373.1 trehalose-phosphatase [Siculibacillus lacustris]